MERYSQTESYEILAQYFFPHHCNLLSDVQLSLKPLFPIFCSIFQLFSGKGVHLIPTSPSWLEM